MQGRHTPGPWTIDFVGTSALVVGSDGLTVAEDVDTMPNARLIAAAPDLLTALRAVMSWVENWDCPFKEDDEWPLTRDQVAAAIAKATGQ